jgi:hypothetical protein
MLGSSVTIGRRQATRELAGPEPLSDNKAKVARAYNKKVKLKEFQVRYLVWEAVLPLGTKDACYGKWSPNWHGPYRIDQVLPGNAYMHEELEVSSSQWLSMVSISRSIFQACGRTNIEQPMICIRLYREGGRYVESTNNKKIMQKKKERKKKGRHRYNSR